MSRFWERPYGLRFAVGIEDTFVPQSSPGLRPLDEYELTGHYDKWREDFDLAASDDPIFVHVEATFRYLDNPEYAERIEFLRQWTRLIYDLLFGRVEGDHPLHNYLAQNGFAEEGLATFLPDGKRRSEWSGTEGMDELVRGFHARYGKPIFWTETSVPGTIEERLRWLSDSLDLARRLRSEGLPLFSLLDWAYREGEEPPEAYLWHMGMYDLEPDGNGNFVRIGTPVVGAFRSAIGRASQL